MRAESEVEMGAAAEDHKPIRYRSTGFLVFVSFALFIGIASGFLALEGIDSGLHAIARTFLRGGAFLVFIQLLQLVVVFNLCALSWSYFSRDRLPSSLFVFAVISTVGLGVIGTYFELGMAERVSPFWAPEDTLAFVSGTRASAHLPLLFGGAIGASTAWLVALLAAIRALVRQRSDRRGIWGGLILGWGVLTAGGVAWFFYERAETYAVEMATLALGVAGFGAILCLGLGAIGAPETTRDRTNRLLLALAAPTCVGLTWMVHRMIASYRSWSALEQAAVARRGPAMAYWLEVRGHIDLVGAAFLALVTFFALASLVIRLRPTMLGIARFRVSAALATLCLGVVVFFAHALEDRSQELVDSANRSDGSYVARAHQDLQLPLFQSALTVGEPQPTVVITPRTIDIDEQVVARSEGFTAQGSQGAAFRETLARALEAWDAEAGAGEEEDGDEPGYELVAEAPWREAPISLALDKRTPWSAVEQVITVLRELRVENVDILVRVGQPREDLPPDLREIGPWPWEYGRHRVSVRSAFGLVGDPRFPGHGADRELTLAITDDGFRLGAQNLRFTPECYRSNDRSEPPHIALREEHRDDRECPSCIYDLPRLRRCLDELHYDQRVAGVITIGAHGGLRTEVVARVMETVRGSVDDEHGPPLFNQQIVLPSPRGEVLALLPERPPEEPPLGSLHFHSPMPGGLAPSGGRGIGLGRLGVLRGRGPAPRPRVRLGGPVIRGALSRELVRRYVRRHSHQIRYCYEHRLRSDPSLSGRISVRFVISSMGNVVTTAVDRSTMGDPAMESCVARAIQSIAFPAAECGGVVIVTYPFDFSNVG